MKKIILNTTIFILFFGIASSFGQTVSEEAKRYNDRGIAAVEMAKSPEDYAAAIKEFEQAVKIAPDWPIAYYNLGRVQEKVEKYSDAITNLKQYIRLAPKASDAETVKSLINKLEYKKEQEDGVKRVYEMREFAGDWIISNYEEGETKTLQYDGDVVKIIKQGDIFYIDGPTWFFSETRFKLSGSKLVGVNKPAYKRLKENFPPLPESVLQQAAGNAQVVYTGNLTMRQDGRILVEGDNLRFYWANNRFDHVERYPGWTKFTLTRKDASINAKKEYSKRTLLHNAALLGEMEVAEQLIAKGADVNAKDEGGDTPLHLATMSFKKEMVELLIDKGADINARNKYGVTPLRKAMDYGIKEIAEMLKEHGAR